MQIRIRSDNQRYFTIKIWQCFKTELSFLSNLVCKYFHIKNHITTCSFIDRKGTTCINIYRKNESVFSTVYSCNFKMTMRIFSYYVRWYTTVFFARLGISLTIWAYFFDSLANNEVRVKKTVSEKKKKTKHISYIIISIPKNTEVNLFVK